MHQFFQRLLERLSKAEQWLAFCLFVAIGVIIFLDVLAREVLGRGYIGATKLAVFAMIYCAMVAFGIATAKGGHLRTRALDGLSPPSWLRARERIGHLLTSIILAVVAWYAWEFLKETFTLGEVDQVTHVQIWMVQIALPIGFAVNALRTLIYAVWPEMAPQPAAEV
jgi:C4-dicarboxylate transporter, DctQ subunit